MIRILATCAALLMAQTATAHDNHKHDSKGPNGGVLAEAGDYHLELLTKGNAIEVHVLDHDNKPVPTTGYKGLAILSVQGKSQRITLEPAAQSQLVGKAETTLPGTVKGVVRLTPPNGKAVQAKFD